MATRSYIALQEQDKFRYIYCHYDGYLEGVGKKLYEHYQDVGKIERLLDLGDISSLGSRLAPGEHELHTARNKTKDTTLAYARDCGETDVEAKIVYSGFEFLNAIKQSDVDYIYLYIEKQGWMYTTREHRLFAPLKDVFEKQD